MQHQHAHGAAPQQAGQALGDRAADQPAEQERRGEAGQHPEHERAADEVHDRVGDQVRRVARLQPALGVDEQPARRGRGRGRAARRAGRARGRRAASAGRPACPSTRGACGDRRPTRSRAPRSRPSRARPGRRATALPVLKARWVKRRWKPTVIPRPVATYMIANTIRSLQPSSSDHTCQATRPSARIGSTVTVPVRNRSRFSFATGWTSSRCSVSLTVAAICGASLACRRAFAPQMRSGSHPASVFRRSCAGFLGFFVFFGFGLGSVTRIVRCSTPSGPLGPCAVIRSV